MFNELCNISSDINEHLPTLMGIAKECNHITEMGVRYCVSTWAFVEGMTGGKLVCIDIKHPSFYQGNISKVEDECRKNNIEFQFIEASTLDIKIEKTDLLFIDTLHTREQLEQELKLHANKVQKYIVLHDTVSCENELMPVIDDFIKKGKWKIKEHHTNNNGLMILEK